MTMNKKGLYIHIPFCRKKCAYCDFYSLCDFQYEDDYISALTNHISLISKDTKSVYDTVFIGGGTPSALSPHSLDKLFDSLRVLDISENAEISLEANPATLDDEKLKIISNGGVNRISLGLQSADDTELSVISRIHNYSEFLKTYELVRKFVNNVNVDLMYGLPSQSIKSFEKTLLTVSELSPEHISVYGLRIEDDTPFGKIKDSLVLPTEDNFSDMYLMASEILRSSDYLKYEISNFSKDGYECKHNLKYWQGCEYIGLGPCAHSHRDQIRYSYKRDISGYIDSLKNNKLPEYDEYYLLSSDDLINEKIMLSLRLAGGLDTKELLQKFGKDILGDKKDEIDMFINGGYAEEENGFIYLTDKGMLVSNYIISELLY